MASYASLVSLEHVLEQILDHHHHRDQQQIKSLQENIAFLVAFLDDFPEDACSASLEERMRNAANRAEDILERRISYEMSWDKELLNVMKEVETIVQEVVQIKTNSGTKDSIVTHNPESTYGSSSSRLGPSGKDTIVVGFEGDLLEIKDRLCGESSKLGIIPIIGMGGIGKTTLARYVYDDPLTTCHFDVRAWATISHDCSIKKIFLSILSSIDPSIDLTQKMSKEILLERLYKFLKGRRYLIVMDDVWDANVWDALRRALPNDSNGSRIIITSRHEDVTSCFDQLNRPHQMNLMDEDQSWNLLREKVFAQEYWPHELEQIGKFIARKCGGLPLAIVVIAGILSKANPTRDTWEDIASSVNEAVNSSDEKLTEILYLSYRRLPHHLRPCFLYMGSFPENYEIHISRLINLWVAEDFLRSTRFKNLEKVAKEYLKDLIKRSLVLVVRKKYNGNVKTIKVHDLLRNLCLKIARNENFFQVVSKVSLRLQDCFMNSRRLSALISISVPAVNDSPIRTVLLFKGLLNVNNWRCFKLLRILDASTLEFASFPNAISELFHLRYLVATLNCEGKFEVLSSLSKLRNLQTLIIMSTTTIDVLLMLPFGVWKLTQLRHLILSKVILPDPSVEALTALKNLYTLSCVTNFTCSERIVKLLPNLIKLEIIYPLDNISKTGWSIYSLTNLIHFHGLEVLSITATLASEYDIPFLKTLQKSDIAFPMALRKLTLCGCRLPWHDMTITGSLPNLEMLNVLHDGCYGDEWETNEGEFRRLKVLEIIASDPWQWVTESSHFPRLQQLRLSHCQLLREIPACIGDIPTLELITVEACHASIADSAERIAAEQMDLGNMELQVHIDHDLIRRLVNLRMLQGPMPKVSRSYRRPEFLLRTFVVPECRSLLPTLETLYIKPLGRKIRSSNSLEITYPFDDETGWSEYRLEYLVQLFKKLNLDVEGMSSYYLLAFEPSDEALQKSDIAIEAPKVRYSFITDPYWIPRGLIVIGSLEMMSSRSLYSTPGR